MKNYIIVSLYATDCNMKLIEAYTDRKTWFSFRRSLYHELDEAFDNEEMDLIEQDKLRESYLILNNSDQPIGLLELSLRNFVDGCLSSPVAYIEGIYLIDDVRGEGYGRGIINWTKEWGRSKGCTELASDVELENESAQRFHVATGFKETYRVVEYKMAI